MTGFLLRRLGSFAATLVAASLIVFAVLELLPGRPAEVMLGDTATPEAIAALEARLGLDRPVSTKLRCRAETSASSARSSWLRRRRWRQSRSNSPMGRIAFMAKP